MNIYELKKYRGQLFSDLSEDNSVTENDFIEYSLDILLDSKLIDNKSNNDSYISSFSESLGNKTYFKINSYIRSETGERLQIFIVDEDGLFFSDNESLQSTQEYYNSKFKLCENFINLAFKKKINNISDQGQINALLNYMGSSDGMHEIDAIDIFLVSPTITYQKLGSGENLKDFDFKDSKVNLNFSRLKEGHKNEYEHFSKEIDIYKHLINLNYLYNNYLMAGNRTSLVIDFKELDFPGIKLTEAVNEEKFESFITVLPATLLTKLYQKYSFRLLEKNVRSFLQFKGPNKGMRETLQKEPEKFIAYNNGLTVTATGKTFDENGFLDTLTDFQIVNGGQTTASIYFSKKDGIDISKVFVTAKINIAKNSTEDELDDLISNISKYSNSQTKVSIVDLRSRNSQLGRIKNLSESVMTPTSKKWFFEKSRGEFNTLLRMSSNKNSIEKQYPRDKRLSKEQLGKYYSSWGNSPYLIKKGGEAVFRIFIEDIDTKEITRNFFEDLIGRVIFFKVLEEIHGTRDKAISQIRSAIIPYTISVIHHYTDNSKGDDFNFFKIWKDEGLTESAQVYFYDLMRLILRVIKDNATSDDLSENSKKEELWKSVLGSKEIQDYMTSSNSQILLKEYSIKKSEKKKLLSARNNSKPVNFELLKNTSILFDKGENFFKKIQTEFYDSLSKADNYKIDAIIASIKSIRFAEPIPLNDKTVQDFEKIKDRLIAIDPEKFDKILSEFSETDYSKGVDWVIKKYNEVINGDGDFYTYFKRIADIAAAKDVKYTSNFKEISDSLSKNNPPSLKNIYYLNFYLRTKIV
ncbi:MAG: AIPR family protein [Chlorobi bacterium]|nr:AIPR family protein [Chlorobiota bacterium]